MYGLIYMHTCTITGKSYIGQTTKTMLSRWKEHLSNKKNTKFHKELRMYNEKYWVHKVLAYAENKDDLDAFEIFFIKKFDTIKNGYNSKTGGAHGLFSEEIKKIISEKKKGVSHPHTVESKSKISNALKGVKFSEKHKENISKSKKGRKWTAKQREIFRDMFRGEKNPNFGKKTKKETIDKMRKKMGKMVLCVELNKTFSCAGEAAEFIGVKRCGIQKCLTKGGTSHGYHWIYIRDGGVL